MSVHVERSERRCRVRIEGEMTIYTAAQHKTEILDRLGDCEELEVDLAAVGEVDGAGLQILLVLKREAAQRGRSLRLVNHSEAVFEVLELLDMQAFFGDPVEIPAEWRTS